MSRDFAYARRCACEISLGIVATGPARTVQSVTLGEPITSSATHAPKVREIDRKENPSVSLGCRDEVLT
jgi:hypothetical protein